MTYYAKRQAANKEESIKITLDRHKVGDHRAAPTSAAGFRPDCENPAARW